MPRIITFTAPKILIATRAILDHDTRVAFEVIITRALESAIDTPFSGRRYASNIRSSQAVSEFRYCVEIYSTLLSFTLQVCTLLFVLSTFPEFPKSQNFGSFTWKLEKQRATKNTNLFVFPFIPYTIDSFLQYILVFLGNNCGNYKFFSSIYYALYYLLFKIAPRSYHVWHW